MTLTCRYVITSVWPGHEGVRTAWQDGWRQGTTSAGVRPGCPGGGATYNAAWAISPAGLGTSGSAGQEPSLEETGHNVSRGEGRLPRRRGDIQRGMGDFAGGFGHLGDRKARSRACRSQGTWAGRLAG